MVSIRACEEADAEAVLAVFRSNVPRHFNELEELWLRDDLETMIGSSWVLDESGEVVGFGGIEYGWFFGRITLCWGMIRADRHGRGLGMRLLAHRTAKAMTLADPGTEHLTVQTTPAVAGFFRRVGFEQAAHWPRGFRLTGFDLVELRMAFGSPEMAALAARA